MTHAIVIGGTRGLGREVVRHLSEAGHIVSVIGRRPPPDSDREIANSQFFAANMDDGEQFANLLANIVETRGKLNYLVFCQRYRDKGDNWSGELAVTLTATKQVMEVLQDKFELEGDKGVVMVSSVFGHFVDKGQPVGYHVGKAGLDQMVRYYAVHLGRKGIRVNGVTPSTFLKEESRDFYLNNTALHDLYKSMIPLGRMGTTADSAKAIRFLCSSEASFINGQNLYVDGGLSLVWPETLARQISAF